GIVTLDDLVMEGLIDFDTVRSVVRAQIEARGAPTQPEAHAEPTGVSMPPGRARALMRRRARAENTYGRMMRAVGRHTGLERGRTEQAVAIVLSMICRRLTPPEARHLIAQLPSKLHPELERCLDGPDKRITTFAIEEALCRSLNLDPARATD